MQKSKKEQISSYGELAQVIHEGVTDEDDPNILKLLYGYRDFVKNTIQLLEYDITAIESDIEEWERLVQHLREP